MRSNVILQLTLVITIALSYFGLSPYAAGQDTPPAANSLCPVMEGEPVNMSLYVDHGGKRVYFCCTFCVSKFKSNPEKYMAKLSGSGDNSNTAEPLRGMTPEEALESDKRNHLPPILQFLGKLHPMVVHFPIALILATLFAEVLAMLSDRLTINCRASARFMLPLGALGSIPAVILGWFAADGAADAGEIALLLYRHRWLGVITLGVSILAALLQFYSESTKKSVIRGLYLLVLLAAAILVAITGHLGGLLVYGADRF